jgi:hypothetical protein
MVGRGGGWYKDKNWTFLEPPRSKTPFFQDAPTFIKKIWDTSHLQYLIRYKGSIFNKSVTIKLHQKVY